LSMIEPPVEPEPRPNSPVVLEPLPYQLRLCEFFRAEEPTLWQWFRGASHRAKEIENFKFELLKTTYRIDRQSQPTLYEAADDVARRLGVDAPITIYQAHNPEGRNAALVRIPGEVHLVLHGDLAAQLTPVELRALFGHELTHFVMHSRWNGDLATVERMLVAICNERHSHPAHHQSLRYLSLYGETLCDRGAFEVVGDLNAVVTMLLKFHTGVRDVDAAAFLRQIDEIFAKGPSWSEGLSHPEAYIRARAMKLWAECREASAGQNANDATQRANDAIAEMIEGRPDLGALDLLQQRQVATGTRRVLDALFAHRWFRTDQTLAHARRFFPKYTPIESSQLAKDWPQDVRVEPQGMADYHAFLLLDFVAADHELDAPAMALAIVTAERLGIKPRFLELARQELKLRKQQLEKIEQDRERLMQEAEQERVAS
ncbi:MAG TPA: hypothetical protein PLV92_07980, partial [Pirellulaceae bacterium]|nr:hypothetical protein [Pirellulaceae bacterium]